MGAKFAKKMKRFSRTHLQNSSLIDTWTIFLFYGKEMKHDCFYSGFPIIAQIETLTWDMSKKNVTFLDLEIMQEDNTLGTKTHFKNVDKNSCLLMESCRHQNWLCNIPKGQLIRLRRSCSKRDVFLAQDRPQIH